MANILSSRPESTDPTHSQSSSVSLSKTIEKEISANAQYKLTSLLQTTIELEPLFELFFGQIQHLLKLGSCQFQNDEKNVFLKFGNASTHSCNYTLSIQNQDLGKITFTRQQRFSQDELAQLEIMLGSLVYPLRNTLNYRDALNQALSDPLTGLGNRGALESALEHQWQMAQRYEQDLCALMIDIDHFKKINDTYGHDTGDQVIKFVAETIKTTTRQTDLSFRYGGEEFLVLLNKTNPTGSTIIAERIRENIQNLILKGSEANNIEVTVSIGGCVLTPGLDKSLFIKQADKALYIAKNSGRNRVEFFKDENATEHTGFLSV